MDGRITIPEAMRLLGRSEKSIRNYIKQGRLHAEIGTDGRYHLLKSDVLSLAKHPAKLTDKVASQLEEMSTRLATMENMLNTALSRLEELTSQTTPTVAPQPTPEPPTTELRARPATAKSSSSGRVRSARDRANNREGCN